ncbi:MAG: DUF1501 domain-containing protein [Verrucomicrobia subdivision 3 bacterium]|nr:DUF1501 domain-containing protein [Limisphaerales bacterium]
MNSAPHFLYCEHLKSITRRHFFGKTALGIGGIALGSLLNERLLAQAAAPADPLAPKPPHFPAKAKRVVYLHMAGSPSQLDLFDYKPKLNELNGQACPESFFKTDRFAFIKGVPKLLGTPHKFARHGQSNAELSNLLPHLATVVDDIAIVRSMHTDQFNHAPAQIFLFTGSPRQGRPSMGSWLTYGLGSESQGLPGFVVLVSGGKTPDGGASLWGSAFLPTVYQGVQCRAQGDPVLYVSNPPGMSPQTRRRSLDALKDLNEMQLQKVGDPETVTRIAQYELAYKMQTSVPELMQIDKEPKAIHELYGTEPGKISFANNCLLARRLLERGVRFVQLFHWGWDQHGDNKDNDIRDGLVRQTRQTDQACTALIKDLKQRGMLDDTLIVWGGEFGRTPMNEDRTGNKDLIGRDHHPHAFTIWMAGGGIKSGVTYGSTDELGYHIAENKVHVHDLQATILHCLGLEHTKLTYKFQGRDYRLTDVHGEVIKGLLA